LEALVGGEQDARETLPLLIANFWISFLLLGPNQSIKVPMKTLGAGQYSCAFCVYEANGNFDLAIRKEIAIKSRTVCRKEKQRSSDRVIGKNQNP
jgi:hypothetical protein